MKYIVEIEKPVIKYLEKLPENIYKKLKAAILSLKKIQGREVQKSLQIKRHIELGLAITELFT